MLTAKEALQITNESKQEQIKLFMEENQSLLEHINDEITKEAKKGNTSATITLYVKACEQDYLHAMLKEQGYKVENAALLQPFTNSLSGVYTYKYQIEITWS